MPTPQFPKLDQVRAQRAAIAAKLRPIADELKAIQAKEAAGIARDGHRKRAANLMVAANNLAAEAEALKAEEAELAMVLAAAGNPDFMESLDGTGTPRFSGQWQPRPAHAWTESVVDELGGKSMRQRGSHSTTVPVAAILNAWPADPLRENSPDTVPHPAPRRRMFVSDVLEIRTVDTDGVSYIRQTARTNNAAPVARHGEKPTSTYGLTRIQDRTRTIAHLTEQIAVQDLDDSANLGVFVEEELIHGLLLGLDDQIVAGDGVTGEQMEGLLTVAQATQAFSNDPLETSRKAITALETVEVFPTAWLMNPADWEDIDVYGIAADLHVPANAPLDRAARKLWSVPVVVTNSVPAGTALLGDFSGARLAVRQDARIDWQTAGFVDDGDDNHHDLFDHNEARARAELRAVLEVLTPSKFIIVSTEAA